MVRLAAGVLCLVHGCVCQGSPFLYEKVCTEATLTKELGIMPFRGMQLAVMGPAYFSVLPSLANHMHARGKQSVRYGVL